MNRKDCISNLISWISISIAIGLVILELDITLKFIPFIRIPSSMYFLAIYIYLIGSILAIISLVIKRGRRGYCALLINIMLFILEVLFFIMGFKYLIH